jgi:long-subunit fatty acid transport protein
MSKFGTIILGGVVSFNIAFGTPIEIGIGAKSQGMGGAFVGVADDASAAYWNPAGLGFAKNREVRFMHWSLSEVANVYVDWFGLAYPMGPNLGSIGVSWIREYAKLECGRDTTMSSMSENTYSLSYGLTIWEHLGRGLYIGGTINRLSFSCDIESSSGIGFDVGLLWIPIRILRFGFLMRNISANMGDENFPTTYRMGIGLGTQKFIVAFDISTKQGVNNTEGISIQWFGGINWNIVPQFAVRVGSNYVSPFTGGIGFMIKGVILDYSYSGTQKEGLTSSHRIELGYKF